MLQGGRSRVRITISLDFSIDLILLWNRNSVVDRATSYGLDDRGVGVRVAVWSRIFSMLSRPVLGPTRPPIQRVPGAKQQVREVDDSPPTSAEVKKMWIYTSTPPYDFIAYLVKHSDNFIFALLSPNPSSRTMALWSTQPLTETSAANLLGG
jgi:hypothetical protein